MAGLTDEEREALIASVRVDPSLWRAEASAAHAQVSDELQRVRGRAPQLSPENATQTEIEIAKSDLDTALQTMAPPDRSGQKWLRATWDALKLYYSGASIERTWSAIHRASAALYMLYDASELPAQATRLHELIATLPGLSSQLTSLTSTMGELSDKQEGFELKARAALRELYQEAIDASAALQGEARVLRNTLLIASGALFAIVLALGVVHMLDPSIISLCASVSGHEICPAGGAPHPFDVFAIELAGMLGGILSVVIPLATGERISTPYRVFNHQLLLKILAGAASGVAGVVLVESGFISAFTFSDGAAIVGYAIFFGFAQQALTGIVDRRVSTLAKQTPSTKSS